jgi:hypothetical protein
MRCSEKIKGNPLTILLVEDNPDHAELIFGFSLKRIKQKGYS